MYALYRGRSHAKKHCKNGKPKLSTAERKKRAAVKKLAKLFPAFQFHLPGSKHKSIYQHSIKSKTLQAELFSKII